MTIPRGPMAGLLAGLLLAGTANGAGEGSGTNNPDLYGLDADSRVADGPPREGMRPFFDIDWSVALRGSYELDSGTFAGTLAPEVTLTHQGVRQDVVVTLSNELAIDEAANARLAALRLGVDATYAVDAVTDAAGSLDLLLTQADPDDPLLPANTAIAPLVFAGAADGLVKRRMGQFEGTLRGSVGRTLNGVTTLDDASTIDNTAENDWTVGTGARLGYAVTPLLTAFVDGELEWQKFDAPSASLLVYLDGLTYAAKTGLTYTLDLTFSAEGAVGVAWRDYTDASLDDAATFTVDGSVTLRPDETRSLVGALTTSLGPSETVPGDSVVSTDLTATGSYIVNPHVTLRGTAGWGHDRIVGTGDEETRLSFGTGIDYKVTDHVALTGDYAFTRTDAPPAPLEDTQTVTVGVTFSR